MFLKRQTVTPVPETNGTGLGLVRGALDSLERMLEVICWQPVSLNPPIDVAVRFLFLTLIHNETILDLEPKRQNYF